MLKRIFVYKHVMNFLIKAIAIATVISLMPLVTGVVVPEYAGFNLEAADDTKKKKRKRRCQTSSEDARNSVYIYVNIST